MKPLSLHRIIVLIYINFWYIPLILFLIGLKACLLSFLLGSLTNRGHSQDGYLKEGGKWGQVLYANKTKKTSLLVKKKIPVEILQEWDTLEHLENARIRPTHANRTDPNSIWLILNRVPSCGGTEIVKILDKLGTRNGFSHQPHEYRTPWQRFLIEQEQESLVTWFEYQHLPKSYDRHFYFVNFTKYQKFTKERPIYINLLRDPVTRLESEFHFRRNHKDLTNAEITRRNKEKKGSGKDWFLLKFDDCILKEEEECLYNKKEEDGYTLSVPFFCGQHNSCVAINDKWGLQMAKFNIEKYYSVVGIVERMDQTLSVLESYVPKFFAGAAEIYKKTRKDMTNDRPRVPSVSAKARKALEQKLFAEVDLYRFANQRLALQYAHTVNGTL